jgi:hypothetical protein
MNRTATIVTTETPAPPAPAGADANASIEDRLQQALDASGQAQPTQRGWIRRVNRTSPLETRFVAR